MGTPLRFIARGRVLSDVSWLNAEGFDEVGLFVDDGACPSPEFIHNAGIQYAVLFPFNDASNGPGTFGDAYAGYMQTVRSVGWDMVGGGGVSGDIVRVAMNYMSWCNYENDVYAPPYNHPTSGPDTYHVDYVDTIDSMEQAVAIGNCAEVGIRIGLDDVISPATTWIEMIDTARAQGIPCNNVCFYNTRNTDVVAILKTDAYEVLLGITKYYGIRHKIRG